ncbi:MAG: M20/M25/M40 family metallo-hydrolase [Chloroflexi bacterium]|nr:M20/M25/M40 family metallo-hydrolase [Chloroflexota bacterium]
MPVNQDLARQVLDQIDPDEVARLCFDLVSIPSPTGEEAGVADYMLSWYRANGLQAIRQEVEPDRPNAVGILRGSDQGLSLMFNGHMDTSFTGTAADLRMVGEVESDEVVAPAIEDGKVRGLGASNMKGGLAAFMSAARALKRSGAVLRGDTILAGVVGEISRTPVAAYQSRNYRGEGIGTRHLLTHGIHSDYAVCCDGSDLNIVWAQVGVVDVKITTYGRAQAAWGTKRAEFPPIKLNAITKMIKVAEALDTWAERFEEEHIYQAKTGPIRPKVNIGAIEGGAPYRPNYFAGVCSLYVDIRIPPELRPVTVLNEMRQALAPLGIEYDLEPYRSLLGHEGKNVEPLVEVLEGINQHLFGQPLKAEESQRASIWTDTNVYNEMGIPCVKLGPRGKRNYPRAEEIAVDSIVKAAQIYALAALDICNRPCGSA